MENEIINVAHIGSPDEVRAQRIIEEGLRQQDTNDNIVVGCIDNLVNKSNWNPTITNIMSHIPHSVMMPYINYSDEINIRKHKETCLKKRKQRKNKKRR